MRISDLSSDVCSSVPFGARGQEAAYFQRVLCALVHAYGQSTHAADGQPGVVGADRVAHGVMGVVDALDDGRIVGHDGAQHHVGVATHVFSAGHDRDIGAQVQRAVYVAGTPGVVGYQYQFVLARVIGQGGDIEHFEQQGRSEENTSELQSLMRISNA